MPILPQLALHVVEHADEQIVSGSRLAVDRLARSRLHHRYEVSLTRQKVIELHRDERSSGVRLSADRPRLAKVHHPVVANQIRIGVDRKIHLYQRIVLEEVHRSGEDRRTVVDDVVLAIRCPERADSNGHVARIRLEQQRGLRERCAALPELCLTRVA